VDELDAIAARVLQARSGAEIGPWTLELYPTLRCNLDCAFCDTTDRHRPGVAELGEARLLAIVDEAADLGVRRVMVLGGGEPLIAAAAPRLLAHIKARGLAGFLTTNGTRLDRFAPLLTEIGWDEVHVSVDGATAATHDALRGRAGAFRTTIGALCRLRRRAGAPRLGIHTVLTRANLDELPHLVRLAHALGVPRLEVDALIAYRPEQAALALRAEDRPRLMRQIDASLDEADRLGVSTTIERLREPTALARGSVPAASAAACLKAWHHLVVQADGRTSPCCVLAGTGGSAATAPIGTIWREDPSLLAIRAGMAAGRPTPRCAECSENILAHERAIGARMSA
jgi:MoaA/NifB/PqqE/SkfB family radical SAM enzyme